MKSKIMIISDVGSGIDYKALDSLNDVFDNTRKGDTVVIYGGTYDIGDNSIKLKDGVNWKFIGYPRIVGSSPYGIFNDNNVAVNVHFDGDVDIDNTISKSKAVIVNDFTTIKGLVFRYVGMIHNANSTLTILDKVNTLTDNGIDVTLMTDGINIELKMNNTVGGVVGITTRALLDISLKTVCGQELNVSPYSVTEPIVNGFKISSIPNNSTKLYIFKIADGSSYDMTPDRTRPIIIDIKQTFDYARY